MDGTIAAICHPPPLLHDHVHRAVVVLCHLMAGHERIDDDDVDLVLNNLLDQAVYNWLDNDGAVACRCCDDESFAHARCRP